MRFQPKSQKEIDEMGLLPAGVYPFSVTNAKDSVSKKSGADMIVLDLLIHAPDGGSRKVTDYLLESMARKLHSACRQLGLTARYQAGSLTSEDFLSKEGYVKLGIQKGKKKDNSDDFFPDRNEVKDYVDAPLSAAPVHTSAAPAADLAEDVPF